MVAGVAGPPLYLGALAVTGVSRFVLAGLSVALPHVVARRHLVEANTARRRRPGPASRRWAG